MCDVAYVLLVDQVESRARAYMQAAVLARAVGSDGDVPDPDDWRREFDASLVAVPKHVDPKRAALLNALGLRSHA